MKKSVKIKKKISKSRGNKVLRNFIIIGMVVLVVLFVFAIFSGKKEADREDELASIWDIGILSTIGNFYESMISSFLGSGDGDDEKSSGISGGGGGSVDCQPVSVVRSDIEWDGSGDLATFCRSKNLEPGTTITYRTSSGSTTPVSCPCPTKCACPDYITIFPPIKEVCVYSAYGCKDVLWPGDCKSPVYIEEKNCVWGTLPDSCKDLKIEEGKFITICRNQDKKIGDDGKEYRGCLSDGPPGDTEGECRMLEILKRTSKKIEDSCGGKIQQLDENTCRKSGCTYEITEEYLVDYDGHKIGDKITREETYECDYKQSID